MHVVSRQKNSTLQVAAVIRLYFVGDSTVCDPIECRLARSSVNDNGPATSSSPKCQLSHAWFKDCSVSLASLIHWSIAAWCFDLSTPVLLVVAWSMLPGVMCGIILLDQLKVSNWWLVLLQHLVLLYRRSDRSQRAYSSVHSLRWAPSISTSHSKLVAHNVNDNSWASFLQVPPE